MIGRAIRGRLVHDTEVVAIQRFKVLLQSKTGQSWDTSLELGRWIFGQSDLDWAAISNTVDAVLCGAILALKVLQMRKCELSECFTYVLYDYDLPRFSAYLDTYSATPTPGSQALPTHRIP